MNTKSKLFALTAAAALLSLSCINKSADCYATAEQMERLKLLDQRPPLCKTTEEWQNDNYDCIVKNDKLPNVYAKYFHDCYEVETDYVQPTDYCLEVGEHLGIVNLSNY